MYIFTTHQPLIMLKIDSLNSIRYTINVRNIQRINMLYWIRIIKKLGF